MDHYFTATTDDRKNRRKISFYFNDHKIEMMSDDSVFSKNELDQGSRILIETVLKENIEGTLLDLGCGIGNIGILLKKFNENELEVTMSDVNVIAVNLAKENSSLHRQKNEVVLSDGFENIPQSFDVIVSNPPIRTGKKVIYRLFAECHDHLNESGKLYLVIRKQQGAESALKYLKTIGFDCEVIEREKGYWIIRGMKKGE
ncbi:MAG: class I SAM-dependent methyltransferase [Erysipelotrichaceae bacterium]|nr:class I SAM-dependent methyltransferase [Erysipelotrichaceae bacterium]